MKWIKRREALRLLNVTSRGLIYMENKGDIRTRILKDSNYTNPEKEYLFNDIERLIDRPRRRVTKPGRSKAPHGYIYVRDCQHPAANSSGCVYEHRVVMEKHLGRYLNELEVVHHIDGNRSNNAIENLFLYASHGEHLKLAQHLSGRLLKACINLAHRAKIIELLEELGA